MGFEFESKTTPFAVYKFVQSLFIFSFFMVNSAVINPDFDLDKQINVLTLYVAACGAFSFVSLAMMLCFSYKEQEKQEIRSVRQEKRKELIEEFNMK